MARCRGLGLVCFALLVAAASATQLRVGGQRGWSVPDGNAEPYNAWARRLRFQIGDQLRKFPFRSMPARVADARDTVPYVTNLLMCVTVCW
jgi:hypothetical protein